MRSAGVADFNLVRLSSVIPPQSVVSEVDGPLPTSSGEGDLLYCVYADGYATVAGQQVWAGLAWSRKDPLKSPSDQGGGLFVEHSGGSRRSVERDLGISLAELSRGRGGGYSETGRRIVSVTCVDRPVCAVVVASYCRVSWGFGDG